MNKTVKFVLASAVLAAAALPSFSYAAVVDVSHAPKAITLIDNTLNFGAKFGNNLKNDTFSDKFTFNLASAYRAEAIVSSISSSASNGLSLTSFDLYSTAGLVAHGVQQSTGVRDVWYIPTANLAKGNYFLQVQGFVVSNTSGSFGGNVNVTPVPEPETYGLMLAGLGALGLLSARRKKSKLA
jgi:hypothetical protein